MRRPKGLDTVAVVGIAVLMALSGVRAAGDDDEPRTYTNEDLTRLFGPPAPASPAATSAEPGFDKEQAFIERFLDRQYRLIDDERRHLSEMRDLALREQPPPERYTLALAPYAYSPGCYSWPRLRPEPDSHRIAAKGKGRGSAPPRPSLSGPGKVRPGTRGGRGTPGPTGSS